MGNNLKSSKTKLFDSIQFDLMMMTRIPLLIPLTLIFYRTLYYHYTTCDERANGSCTNKQ